MKSSTPITGESSAFAPGDPITRTTRLQNRLEAFAARIGSLTGKRRLGLSILLGLGSALALPPLYAAPILWLVYPILLWQLNGAASHRKAFIIGWGFGFGQFVVGFYWISVSMFTDIAHWWWAVPFASTLLPILLGFIPGFACMMWWRMRLTGLARVLGFTAWITLGEWFRSHFLTGFPWNVTAHTWIAWLPMLQSYSILGAHGLGFLTIAAAGMLSLSGVAGYAPRRAIFYNAAALGILAMLAIWGCWRIPAGPAATVPNIIVRLVQPDIPQGEKSSQELWDQHFDTLLALSTRKPLGAAPTAIVWPETAMPYPLNLSPGTARTMPGLSALGVPLLMGAVRYEKNAGDLHVYNSMVAVDAQTSVLSWYDKTHLAPFGEYMPFRNVLHLDALAVGGIDLSFGSGPATLDVPGLPPFGTLICYEAIFPERLIDPAHRPQWLLQVTNDGWFGNSSGPYQHFAMARARAVEQGLPLLRAANTGISASVDPYGRTIDSLPIGVRGVLDVQLPQAIAQPPFYAQYGDILYFLMLTGTLAILMARKQR